MSSTRCPSFMDQGEFGNSSSVADIVEVECEPVYAEHTIRFSANELYSRCEHHLSWSLPYPYSPQSGSSFSVTLDNDGNATAVIWGGPGCAAGESLISAHLEQAPYTTVTTPFTVLPPRPSPPGVYALPSEEVENEETSSVATIVQVEFPPVFAEEDVNINAEQLYSRCHIPPQTGVGRCGRRKARRRLEPRRPEARQRRQRVRRAARRRLVRERLERDRSEPRIRAVHHLHDRPSRSSRPSPPCRCPRASRSKSSSASAGEATFTKSELTGQVGQTVEYEIVVRNTGNTPLQFSHFQDANCEGISGGPGEKLVQPGQATVFTCTHKLTAPGNWINAATIEGNEGTGKKESNEVMVKVPAVPPVRASRSKSSSRSAAGPSPRTNSRAPSARPSNTRSSSGTPAK